jgi:hypothetical protein
MIYGGDAYYFHIWISCLTLSFRPFEIPLAKFHDVPSNNQRVTATKTPFIDKRIAVKQKNADDDLF